MSHGINFSGAAALQQTLKPSEQTATLPGAEDGGTNLSAAFATTLPQTTSERDVLRMMEANVTIAGSSAVTGAGFLDSVRGGRDEALAAGADWVKGLPNLGIADLGTKISEGASAMVSKFSGENNPFTKLASKATSFLGLSGPKALGKTGAGALTDVQRAALFDKPAGDASAVQVNAALQTNEDDKSYLVTLTESATSQVVFRILPEITEQRSIEYEAVQPPQFPGAFQKYKGTSSVQWTVNAMFVCRTTAEATENLEFLNRLRGWSMPFFGDLMAQDKRFKSKVGAPPPVLIFQGLRTNIIGPVPVVITSLSWNWPSDVDYIPAQKLTDSKGGIGFDGIGFKQANVPFPAVMSVAIQLIESFSTAEFNGFDLGAYRVGDFANAYKPKVSGTSAAAADVAQVPAGQEAQGQGNVAQAISEPPTAMDGEGGRLPISPTAGEGNVQDLGLG